MRNSKEIEDLRRRTIELEQRIKHVPVRSINSSPQPVPWLTIVGQHTLNASPAVTGIFRASTTTWTDPGALSPGACDPLTGAQTVAPSGSFTVSLGLGVANMRIGNGSFVRVLVINNWTYPYSVRTGTLFLADQPLAPELTPCAGFPTQIWRIAAP